MNTEFSDLEKAIEFHTKGELSEAEAIYKNLLELEPDNIQLLHFYGLLLFQKQEFDNSLEILNKVLGLRPNDDIYTDILIILAEIYTAKGNHNKAIEYYNRVLEIDSSNVIANYCLGNAYLAANTLDKALEYYLAAIRLTPILPELYFNTGVVCSRKQDGGNAIRFFEQAIEQNPDYAEAYINLGELYSRIPDYDKAIQYNLKALELNPNFLNIYNNLGNIYADLCELDKAENITNQGLKLFPDNEYLLLILSRINMIKGNYESGWDYFKYRRIINEQKHLGPYLLDYNGSLDGKKVYVYWDTGFGDTIQFARYIPLLKEKGAEVLFAPQKDLESLFSRMGLSPSPQVNEVKIISDNINTQYDYQVNLTSLAYLFKTNIDNIPLKEGYLTADPEKVQQYKEKYFNNKCFKLGLVWQTVNPSSKSIENINTLLPLLQIPDVKAYSLLKENSSIQLESISNEITNIGETFKDFSDTAAAIENLDLLISIDTSVAHLAGALGKPVWIMLPNFHNWRWLLDTNYSPWYKSARLFRQKPNSDWNELIKNMAEELKDYIIAS